MRLSSSGKVKSKPVAYISSVNVGFMTLPIKAIKIRLSNTYLRCIQWNCLSPKSRAATRDCILQTLHHIHITICQYYITISQQKSTSSNGKNGISSSNGDNTKGAEPRCFKLTAIVLNPTRWTNQSSAMGKNPSTLLRLVWASVFPVTLRVIWYGNGSYSHTKLTFVDSWFAKAM